MAYDGILEDVREAIALKKPKRMNLFACSEEFDVHWYGKYSYEEVCQDGAKMAEVWIAAIDEFDYDWAWLQVDDCFELEPLGVATHGKGDFLRATVNYLPATRETLEGLKIPDPEADGRMPEKLKALRLLREHFGDTILVTGSCAAPYSCTSLILGLEETMMLALTDPELLAEFCEFCIELEYRYIKAQYQAGAHAIWVGDCNAFSGMLSLEQYKQFAFGPCRKLVEKVKKNMDVIVYLHNSEEKVPNLLAQAELGADIINLGPGAEMAEVRKAMTGRCCFSGNLDPIEVLMRGTPEQVVWETQRIIETCREPGGYLFCTGEMNPRDVPVENMKALSKAIKTANRT